MPEKAANPGYSEYYTIIRTRIKKHSHAMSFYYTLDRVQYHEN